MSKRGQTIFVSMSVNDLHAQSTTVSCARRTVLQIAAYRGPFGLVYTFTMVTTRAGPTRLSCDHTNAGYYMNLNGITHERAITLATTEPGPIVLESPRQRETCETHHHLAIVRVQRSEHYSRVHEIPTTNQLTTFVLVSDCSFANESLQFLTSRLTTARLVVVTN